MSLTIQDKTTNSFVPSISLKCGYCGNTAEKLQRCARCQLEKYCGIDCQKKHWLQHKKVCQITPKKEEAIPPTPHLIIEGRVDGGEIAGKAPITEQRTMTSALQKNEENKEKSSSTKEIVWGAIQKEFKVWRGGKNIQKELKVLHDGKQISIPLSNSEDRTEFWAMFAGDNVTPVPSLLKEGFNTRKEGMIALDLGCGRGASSIYLLQRGWKVVAIDNSAGTLDIFQKTANKINAEWIKSKKLTILKQDINECDFPEKLDLILGNDVFPYCNPDKLHILWNKLHGSLKENGYLVGSFFTRLDDLIMSEMMSEMGAWFVDDMQVVKTLLNESNYKTKICRHRPAEEGGQIEFIGQKKS